MSPSSPTSRYSYQDRFSLLRDTGGECTAASHETSSCLLTLLNWPVHKTEVSKWKDRPAMGVECTHPYPLHRSTQTCNGCWVHPPLPLASIHPDLQWVLSAPTPTPCIYPPRPAMGVECTHPYPLHLSTQTCNGCWVHPPLPLASIHPDLQWVLSAPTPTPYIYPPSNPPQSLFSSSLSPAAVLQMDKTTKAELDPPPPPQIPPRHPPPHPVSQFPSVHLEMCGFSGTAQIVEQSFIKQWRSFVRCWRLFLILSLICQFDVSGH